MHLHILGIAGTFMGGIAQIARAAGHTVTGADAQVYPPMSDQLESAGIAFREGFDPEQLTDEIDQVVVGNVMSRGRPIVEAMLNRGMPYTSGPQWLYENVLKDRWVLAVSGTHGKTSTASMLAWILEYAGLKPGFLIGGVPLNFGISARLGESPFFVIEADEYDTAFFDKRSKFVHYRPRTLIINNLEYDHADIFPDLASIQRQFHHLVRMVPGEGLLVCPQGVPAVEQTLAMGCWTPQETVAVAGNGERKSGWCCKALTGDYTQIEVWLDMERVGTLKWSQLGAHNASNALAAIAAARHAGVPAAVGLEALASFKGIKRRMELKGEVSGIRVFDDFAHHPTAIETTLNGLRENVGSGGRVLAVFEPRSNTMKLGVHRETLAAAFAEADEVFLYVAEDLQWRPDALDFPVPAEFSSSIEGLVEKVVETARPGDQILVMSNGGFGGVHGKLLAALKERFGE